MPSPIVIMGAVALLVVLFGIRLLMKRAAWRRRQLSEGARLKAFMALDPGREEPATDPDRER